MPPHIQIYVARAACLLTASSACILALGLLNEFTILDGLIALLCFFLAVFSYIQGYKVWSAGFLLAAVIFQPFLSWFHIARYQWTILDIALVAFVAGFSFYSTDPYRKGTLFEQYVTTLFPEESYAIVDRTRDISKDTNRRIESDSHPDFMFRNKKTGEEFAVECKFNSRWWNQNGKLGINLRHYQLENYRAFEKERKIPVYIAFGIGGIPEKPREVCFVPLEWIKYDFVYQSVIRAGRRAEEV